MTPRHFEAITFSAKAAVAAVLAVPCYNLSGFPGAGWAAISAVLVSQPTVGSSLKASLTQVTANLIGALIGALLGAWLGHTLLAMAIGILLTGLACHSCKLDNTLRPAFGAVVIVIFTSDVPKWSGPLDRIVAVVIGCLCGLVVGFLFDNVSNRFKLRHQESNQGPTP